MTCIIVLKKCFVYISPVMTHSIQTTGVIILCGGNSERMKYPKPFLKYKGVTLLEKMVGNYCNAGVDYIYVLINEKLLYQSINYVSDIIRDNCSLIINKYPEKGRTYSISTAVKRINKTLNCFLQNIDNPAPQVKMIRKMADRLQDDCHYVSPVINNKSAHPVLIGRTILNHLAGKEGFDWNLRDELRKFTRICYETDDEKLLLNYNTPAEWNEYLQRS